MKRDLALAAALIGTILSFVANVSLHRQLAIARHEIAALRFRLACCRGIQARRAWPGDPITLNRATGVQP